MFSATYTGMNFRPLWTAMVWPTMSGVIVERRDHVLTTRRSRVAFSSATFFPRWSSTNGPFLMDRANVVPLCLRLAPTDDRIVRPLVVPGLAALRLPAPRRRGMTAARRLAFAAAHRVIDRVHRDSAHVRPSPDPAVAAGLADRHVLVLDVSDLTDGRVALDVHLADLAGGEPNLRVAPLFRHELRGGAGRADELPAPPALQLQVVDRRSERDAAQRQGVARDDVRGRTRHDLRADLEPVGRQDVALFPVGVVEQRDPGGTIGVVLDRSDPGRHAHLVPAEVDDPVEAIVASGHVSRGHAALAVAASGRTQADRQRLLGARGGDLVERHPGLEAAAGRRRIEFLERHRLHPFEELDRLLTRGEADVSLLPVLPLPDEFAHPLPLAGPVGDADRRDLDSEERGHGAGDLDLVGRRIDLEAHGVRGFLHPRRLLGDQGTADHALRLHHLPPSVSTTRERASFETTTVPWLITS